MWRSRMQPMTSETIDLQHAKRVPSTRGGVRGWRGSWRWWLTALLLLGLVWSSRSPGAGPADGPGGPVLVVVSSSSPFSTYHAEILRTEGLNAFSVADVSTLSASLLALYDTVLLAKTPLTASQVSVLANWVNAGGQLIAVAPDPQLAPLLGLTPVGTRLSEAYLQIDTMRAPGAGLVPQTLQFHGSADRYQLSGATALATLYSDASTPTTHPALSWRSVGAGQAAAFTYDLAYSIVTTRQGNPAWATQERDGYSPVRSDDKFFGRSTADPQPDWVDANRLAIPQADEQQRLLANLIQWMNRARKPLPRFWYFPNGSKAVVIMTGDDHGNGGTLGRFDQFRAASPVGCSVADWTCVRGTSYMYPYTPVTAAQALAQEADGFEVGVHINTGCADYTAASLEAQYTQQLQDWSAKFVGLSAPSTQRHHCVVWSDWASGATVQRAHGMRLDTTYYHWPPSWVQDVPGVFTGSAMPMRFASLDGKLIDVYQAATQMTDESGQTYPFTVDTLLDRAMGPLGYYGAYTVNAHTDLVTSDVATAVVASAQARGVPVVSARQMLQWLDARNASTFTSMVWNGSSLTFNVVADTAARGLRGMVPVSWNGQTLSAIRRGTSTVPYTVATIKGVDYAFFSALSGAYEAAYAMVVTPPPSTDPCPCTGWSSSSSPAIASYPDPGAVELGVRFTSDVAGYITGIRFYKGANNTGTHRGSLWTASGQLLATALFSSETASGWQEVSFSTPVAISANTVYVASYFAPKGGYAVDTGYFATAGVDRAPLHLLKDGDSGGNGLYTYSATSTFPVSTFKSSNYWVDVSFKTTVTPPPIQGACSAPANAIMAENCLPGSPASQWDVAGSGDPTLQGFATQISVNRGGSVVFKVNTTASAYRFDIYRLGYYGGAGARWVATVQPSASLPQTQPACLNDSNTGLIDCGNWGVSGTWTVPATAVSGIYLARLVRPDTGGASHIVFVVRDDASTSDILFQTSDTTWQAYNTFGGNSLYTGSPAGRAYKVSYNRPFNTRSVDNGQDWLFNAEYPMVRWLEANGYDVSYFSGVDADRYGALIRNHRVFLSVGHDEYWSATQRANVEAARNAGVSLAFLGGNDMFWKTRWEPSIDSSLAAARTLVCYKETHANAKIDPTSVWTGTWRDARFSPPADGGRPENAVIGTLFMVNDGATTAITVPAADGLLRLWRNTTVAKLASGTVATLPSGTLGYEWNVDLDNGARPPGLMRLSTTTVANAPLLLDNGSTYGSGTATHSLTLYRHSSGARVFSAGSVQWAWGLDATHDRSGTPADVRIQQATVNLLADMGAQPRTLQTGLVAAAASTDNTAPTSAITSHVSGTVVAAGQSLTLSGRAVDAGGGVVGGVELSVDGGQTWRRAEGRETWSYTFTPQAGATINVRTRAVDDSGNLEVPGAGITLTTSALNCPCTLWSANTLPLTAASADTAAVNLGVRFVPQQNGFITGVRFYKGATNTGTHVGGLWSATGQLLASSTYTAESTTGWQEVSFASPVAVTAGTTYVASYFAPHGHYAADYNGLATATVNGPLIAPADGNAGGNGLYRYGTGLAFPNASYRATQYWVDVVFMPSVPTVPTVP